MARCFSAKKAKAGKEITCGRCAAVIVPGDQYYYFSTGFRGVRQVRCKHHHPRQSELCGSKMSGAYAANESLEDSIVTATCVGDIASALENAAGEIEEVRDEYQESFDSLPDNFQNGDQGSDIQEKIDGLDNYASSLNDKASEVSALKTEADDEGVEDAKVVQAAKDLAQEALDEFEL